MSFNLDIYIREFCKDSGPGDDFDFLATHDFVTGKLAASPENILDDEVFEGSQQLIAYIPSATNVSELVAIYSNIIKPLEDEISIIDREGFNIDAMEHKLILQYYIYLVYSSIVQLIDMFEKEKDKSQRQRKATEESRKKINKLNDILGSILTSLYMLLNTQLATVFQGEQALKDFCSVVVKCVNHVLSSKDAMKEKDTRTVFIKLISIIAKNYQQNAQISSRWKHDLVFAENSGEFYADLFAEIVSNSLVVYDNKKLLKSALNEFAIGLGDVSKLSPFPKNVSLFLVRLSETVGAELLDVIDHEAFFTFPQTRGAMMVCYGNCIAKISQCEELTKKYSEIISEKIDTIHSHLLDTQYNVRQRGLQALQHILSVPNSNLFLKDYRFIWSQYAVRHLEDKSSYVRKAAFDLIRSSLDNHPFTINEGRLSWNFFWKSYVEFTKQLKSLDPGFYNRLRLEEITENDFISQILSDAENAIEDVFAQILGNVNPVDNDTIVSDELETLLKKRAICRDACAFIKIFDFAFEIAANLLNSNTKTDVLAAIEFFTMGDAYGIESSNKGIKQMLHLVWQNNSNDDGNKVVEKVVDAYSSMYLSPNENDLPEVRTMYVAGQLIRLTYDCSFADLVSLEKLMLELYRGKLVDTGKKDVINDTVSKKYNSMITKQVVDTIWKGFTTCKNINEKRGAIIILSMIALADYKTVSSKIDTLIENGLNLKDLNPDIATYTCIALERSIPNKKPKNFKAPDFESAINEIKKILLIDTTDGNWFNLAEHALNTLYIIDERANESASEVVRLKALHVFNESENNNDDKSASLSQLLFLLGHVGLKTIINLEKIEADFKRSKQENENKKDEQEVEMEMIGGSNEDDFSDAIQAIREKDLLYGSKSILCKFVPVLNEILLHPKKYNNSTLQRQAALCFAKFMCISPIYCRENLKLYIYLMKKSKDPIVKGNLVLGMGDIHVCFSNIIDANRDELYNMLQDKDLTVQRTCLMTITFLILAGQMKVKGQLTQLSKLLVHQDEDLTEMARLFFQELATKDNAIYNGFIEMLSGLNKDLESEKDLEEGMKNFRIIIKFVLPFINKEKHRNKLIDKLYPKMKNCSAAERTRIAFCLKELIRKNDNKKDSESERSKFNDAILQYIEHMDSEQEIPLPPPLSAQK